MVAYELNQQINKRKEVNSQYFSDVKFLFMGTKDIYEMLEEN